MHGRSVAAAKLDLLVQDLPVDPQPFDHRLPSLLFWEEGEDAALPRLARRRESEDSSKSRIAIEDLAVEGGDEGPREVFVEEAPIAFLHPGPFGDLDLEMGCGLAKLCGALLDPHFQIVVRSLQGRGLVRNPLGHGVEARTQPAKLVLVASGHPREDATGGEGGRGVRESADGLEDEGGKQRSREKGDEHDRHGEQGLPTCHRRHLRVEVLLGDHVEDRPGNRREPARNAVVPVVIDRCESPEEPLVGRLRSSAIELLREGSDILKQLSRSLAEAVFPDQSVDQGGIEGAAGMEDNLVVERMGNPNALMIEEHGEASRSGQLVRCFRDVPESSCTNPKSH